MKRILIYILLLVLAVPSPVSAQRRKARPKAKPKVEVPVENPVFVSWLPATARVMVIDSLVTDSVNVLNVVPVNPEEGRLATYADFFQRESPGIVYVNELGSKCIFSHIVGNGRQKHLFQSDKIGGAWTAPVELLGLDDEGRLTDFDYPYLMPDGVTLYFAARGKDGLGGLDIYRTRFDAENGRYLKPENLGLPFNSEADDYLYVVDEQNQLAYFVSSRRQAKDSACVYMFEPFETREVLDAEVLTPEHLRSLARLDRIGDTWGDGTARKKALYRARQAKAQLSAGQEARGEFVFVINDKKTYTRMADFRIAENADRMRQLLSMQQQTEVLQSALALARNYYATASIQKRQHLSSEILNSEQQLEQLQREIHELEKLIRNTENR